MKTFLKYSFIFLCLVLTVACQDQAPIVHDLNERDANEILVILSRNNIKAYKQKEERNQEIYWKISVEPDNEVVARSILVSNNLPRIRRGGLEGICKEAGMVTTELTEKCRMLLWVKDEIINSLESIPGVVSADVVLNIPEKDEFPDEDAPIDRPTASVTIRYLVDAKVKTKITEDKFKEFVANSVTGLDTRDVTVIISYLEQNTGLSSADLVASNGTVSEVTSVETTADPSNDLNDEPGAADSNLVQVGGMVMDESSATKFKVIAGLLLFILLALAGAFIFTLIRMSRLKKQTPLEPEEAPQLTQGEDDQKLLEGM